MSPALRANLVVAAPKIAQAVCAACGDYFTWKLGERTFGPASNEAWAAASTPILLADSAILTMYAAGSHGFESMAMVLLGPHIVELP